MDQSEDDDACHSLTGAVVRRARFRSRRPVLVLSKNMSNMENIMKSSFIAVSALLVGMSLPALADSDNNLSTITQIGTASTATVGQTGLGTMNTATVKQVGGTLNNAEINQTGTGSTNLSTIFQF